jgi:hypothetical protein
MTRWNLNVPKEIDRDVRMLLARRGFKKGDLSRFVVAAVRRELLRETIDDTRARFSDLTPEEVDRLAADAVAWARADRS